jgi:hypothetical protein
MTWRSRRLSRTVLCAIAVAAALALSACETEVTTTVTPTSDTAADVVVSVTVDGELAEIVRDDGDSARRIETIFSDAAGVNPSRTDSDGQITWQGSVAADRLSGASALTGVGAVDVRPDDTGGDEIQVEIQLVDPAKLRSALQSVDGVQNIDKEGAVQAMLSQTLVTVTVVMPGGVSEASSPGDKIEFTQDKTTVTASRRLDDAATGTLVVTGSTQSTPWWLWVARGLVWCSVMAAVWLLVKRRFHRASGPTSVG